MGRSHPGGGHGSNLRTTPPPRVRPPWPAGYPGAAVSATAAALPTAESAVKGRCPRTSARQKGQCDDLVSQERAHDSCRQCRLSHGISSRTSPVTKEDRQTTHCARTSKSEPLAALARAAVLASSCPSAAVDAQLLATPSSWPKHTCRSFSNSAASKPACGTRALRPWLNAGPSARHLSKCSK